HESAGEHSPVRLDLPSPHTSSPRIGEEFIAYRATHAGTDGIWKLEDGAPIELWSEQAARGIARPALSPDGQIAFSVSTGSRTQLLVVTADGSGARTLAGGLDVRGAPAWSPDARWITVGVMHEGAPRLVNVPADGGEPVVL